MNSNRVPTLTDAVSLFRFVFRIPGLLRRPITAVEAHATLQKNLNERENNFLSLARNAIYDNPASPYRKLLTFARCEYGDLEKLVTQDGIETALRTLYRNGVYLTSDEFKGRRPIVRGNAAFNFDPSDFINPSVRPDIVGQTGGSRGPAAPVPINFAVYRSYAINAFLDLQARGGLDWVHAIWQMPGSTALVLLLRFTWFQASLHRWFSLVDTNFPGLHPRYHWSARVLKWTALTVGVRLPDPEHISVGDPLPIARWMEQMLASGKIPHLLTYSSCAVRVCEAAAAHGIKLSGARFTMFGEKITAPRIAAIEQLGARATCLYATTESGGLAMGCMAPEAPDDVHLMHDRCAIIQSGDKHETRFPADALLFTTVLPDARIVLLNVSLGDSATVNERDCGCPLRQLGWTTHLHSIRSFEKLTAAGVTFLDADLIHVLEETLPANFGGGPTDYQLIDEETEDGAPRVHLLVHPRLGALDAGRIRQVFLEAIGKGSGVERVMMSVWRDAGLPMVARETPRLTASGKILHVHLNRNAQHQDRRVAAE